MPVLFPPDHPPLTGLRTRCAHEDSAVSAAVGSSFEALSTTTADAGSDSPASDRRHVRVSSRPL